MALLLISLILLLCTNFNVILGNTCNGGVADTICETGPCDGEYVDRTGGNYYWWACGVDCPGGKYWTDGYCNCACVDRQQCENECKHNRGPCYEGYEDVTDGNFEYWACGVDCPGGKYYTDGVCNCACQDKPDKCPDGVVCGSQGPCEPGYMDKTQGNYNWWACGADCEGGKYYTDGVCNCACQPAGQCAMTPTYHNFNLYRFAPSLAFIRTFGVFGEYLVIMLLLAIMVITTLCCYKKRKMIFKKSNKYKVVSMADSSSEMEQAPINE
mmetsp:Transcript_73283/g.65971  ORF Transcript_73283/g.65971 Transcript_73283/m.65971 type:complete len:269 (-) Transcript_73283:284-1090(-)